MNKTKIALGVIVIVCIVSAIYILIYGQLQGNNQPKGNPEFEIVNFGLIEPDPQWHFHYQITFKLKNIGT
jgi:hypothetical protein